MSNQKLREKIYERMEAKNTKDLIAIWKENDHGLWSDLAFEVIRKLLLKRGVSLPNQGEAKATIPSPPRLDILWKIRHLFHKEFSFQWILFCSFLVWVFIIHPFYFFTYFSGPQSLSSNPLTLWPNGGIRIDILLAVENTDVYFKLFLMLRYIEFGMMYYGILVGYFVLRKSQKAVTMVNIYLIQLLLFCTCQLLFFNAYPILDLYWEITNTVIDLKPDWDMWLDMMYRNSIEKDPQWSIFLETLKIYLLPITVTAIWYIFLIRSKWIATNFPHNAHSSE